MRVVFPLSFKRDESQLVQLCRRARAWLQNGTIDTKGFVDIPWLTVMAAIVK